MGGVVAFLLSSGAIRKAPDPAHREGLTPPTLGEGKEKFVFYYWKATRRTT